ncbi:hypothetical protein [Breoghania sp. JC706]|uniref:hypothetical protein n=1 Tax=Breoghania sp. JC706 TaxID=3117732 RepID=UPI00300BECDC
MKARRVKVGDLFLDSKLNIASNAGIEIEVDTQGLDEKQLADLRRRMYPTTIRSFNKYSDVLESILQSTINSDPSYLGGHKKSIFCRVKSNFTSNGEPRSDVYSRDIETTLLVAAEEAEPEIALRSKIQVDVGEKKRKIALEVDRLVIDEFKRHVAEDTIEERLRRIAEQNLEMDISQSLPVDRLHKVIIAMKPLPESIDIGGRDISGVFATPGGDGARASITIVICYEEEDAQRTWCYDYTFGSEFG